MNNPTSHRESLSDNVGENQGYSQFMKWLHIAALVVTVIGLVGRYLFHSGSMSLFVMLGMGTLALVYFLKAYERPKNLSECKENDENQPVQSVSFFASSAFAFFAQHLYGWSMAVLICGLLFFLQHWPGGRIMTAVGVLVVVIAVVLKIIGNKARNNS